MPNSSRANGSDWSKLLLLLVICASTASVCAFVGCSSDPSDHVHAHIVYHHRPADFPAAVIRLEEIHQTLIRDEPLPATTESRGNVDIFQELDDLVRWLPTIAAESDLPKPEWDQINERCKILGQLTQAMQTSTRSGNDGHSDRSAFSRTFYRERREQFERVLAELRAKIDVYDEWSKKSVTRF